MLVVAAINLVMSALFGVVCVATPLGAPGRPYTERARVLAFGLAALHGFNALIALYASGLLDA